MRQRRFWYVREIPFPNFRNPQGTDFLKEKSSENPARWHLLSWLIYLMRRAKHTRKPIRRMNSNMITVDLKSKFKHDKNDRRNSGGTLRQKFSFIDILHLIFDIWHLTFNQWTNGPMANGPMDQWSNGKMDQWTNGPMDKWTSGSEKENTNR